MLQQKESKHTNQKNAKSIDKIIGEKKNHEISPKSITQGVSLFQYNIKEQVGTEPNYCLECSINTAHVFK